MNNTGAGLVSAEFREKRHPLAIMPLTVLLLMIGLLLTLLLASATAQAHQKIAATDLQAFTDAQAYSEKRLQVVLLINNASNPFWKLVSQAAQKAASDLKVELKVVAINNNPLRPVRVLSALVNSSRKPDAVIFPNIKNTGKAVLDLLEQHKINSIIYDNGFSPKEKMGNPGQYYRYWRGQVAIGNYEASRQLTHKVIRQALEQFPDLRPLPMVVLEGNTASQANAQRLLGMFDALVGYKDQVEIRQIFRTRYDPEHAYNAILTAGQRYPEMKIIWAANDAMALRAADAARETERIPGKDLLITGFDMLPETQDKITSGTLFDSFGGHYMSAAWALVYLDDFLNQAVAPYRILHIPLQSGQQDFRLKIPGPSADRWVTPAEDFSNIDFSLYSKHHLQPREEASSRRYIFEVSNTP